MDLEPIELKTANKRKEAAARTLVILDCCHLRQHNSKVRSPVRLSQCVLPATSPYSHCIQCRKHIPLQVNTTQTKPIRVLVRGWFEFNQSIDQSTKICNVSPT